MPERASSDFVPTSSHSRASLPSKCPSSVGKGEKGTDTGTAWPSPEILFRRALLLPDSRMSAGSRSAVDDIAADAAASEPVFLPSPAGASSVARDSAGSCSSGRARTRFDVSFASLLGVKGSAGAFPRGDLRPDPRRNERRGLSVERSMPPLALLCSRPTSCLPSSPTSSPPENERLKGRAGAGV